MLELIALGGWGGVITAINASCQKFLAINTDLKVFVCSGVFVYMFPLGCAHACVCFCVCLWGFVCICVSGYVYMF